MGIQDVLITLGTKGTRIDTRARNPGGNQSGNRRLYQIDMRPPGTQGENHGVRELNRYLGSNFETAGPDPRSDPDRKGRAIPECSHPRFEDSRHQPAPAGVNQGHPLLRRGHGHRQTIRAVDDEFQIGNSGMHPVASGNHSRAADSLDPDPVDLVQTHLALGPFRRPGWF